MPGYDGTGPTGMGPKTGGGFGSCPSSARTEAGTTQRGIGRGGLPWGGGRGRLQGGGMGFLGFCRGFFGGWGMAPQDEESVLANHASVLERELAATREQLATLKKGVRGEDK